LQELRAFFGTTTATVSYKAALLSAMKKKMSTRRAALQNSIRQRHSQAQADSPELDSADACACAASPGTAPKALLPCSEPPKLDDSGSFSLSFSDLSFSIKRPVNSAQDPHNHASSASSSPTMWVNPVSQAPKAEELNAFLENLDVACVSRQKVPRASAMELVEGVLDLTLECTQALHHLQVMILISNARVGHNCLRTPYMAVYLASFLPKLPCIHGIYMVLDEPSNDGNLQ